MKNLTNHRKSTCLLLTVFVLLFIPFFSNAQDYFVKKDSWQETIKESCDKINHDWIHRTGKFKFVFTYERNSYSFNREINKVMNQTYREFMNISGADKIRREKSDQIWETEYKPGNYNALALKMAWKISLGFKQTAINMAKNVVKWSDFQKVRKLYHLDKDLETLLYQLDREFNKENLLKGLNYLSGKNNWSLEYMKSVKEKIDQLNTEKLTIIENCNKGNLSSVNDIRIFLEKSSGFLRTVFVTKNKLVGTDSFIFLKRFAFQSNHYYTDYVNGCKYYGGNLYLLDLKTGKTSELVPELQNGIFNRFDLDFDAGKVVFDWKSGQQSGFRIYEKNLNTKDLNQLTSPPNNEDELIKLYRVTEEYHHGTDDMHPIYLPDGDICFISTRCQYGILCDAPDNFSTTVLYRMNADGQNIEKLTNSSVSESNPSVMNDGRILYTRWEYLDKGAVSVKCLWAMRPDGTNAVEIYGNILALPPTLLMGRQIPDNSGLFTCLGAPHCCPENGVGTVLKIDISKNLRTKEPLTYVTPNTDIRSEPGIYQYNKGEWQQTNAGPVYCDPYPLSDKMFLVAHNPSSYFNEKAAWGLYLIDDFGNHIPIYSDPEISCWQPIPFKARKKPPVISSVLKPELKEKGQAAVFISNVTHGMEGIKNGEAKYIRVNEQVPRPWSARKNGSDDRYDQQHAVITKDTHLGLKVQHGIVPLEKDGSAYFLVPADKNIFFQVLDENFMEIQRERTYNNFRPGEFRSCIGCHPMQNEAPFNEGRVPLAFKNTPKLPGPQPGETSGLRPIDYMTDVQPIWDKHCVECHSGHTPSAGLDLTGELTQFFCKSYENLLPERRKHPRKDPNYLGMLIGENHPKEQNVHYLPAKSLGSHTSMLYKMLREEHVDIKLSQEELIRISTWIDSNGQYYGTYFGKKNLLYKNDKDFRPKPSISSALGEPPGSASE